ncbi:hypothetical protein HW555_001953 [Spodoptera exigua]|uniref:Uncharacterized protein n=1 Tax=Spodoptera exigua TaxID=7107 RepID=A0A835GS59_SPOEX|nr:hypothetical protein HW555_001953 [Spodoptera exigua]
MLVLSHERGGVQAYVHVPEACGHDGHVHGGRVPRADVHEELVLAERRARVVRPDLPTYIMLKPYKLVPSPTQIMPHNILYYSHRQNVDNMLTHNAILLDMHELVVWRGGEYDDGLDVLRLVVEDDHPQPHLLALSARRRALHLYEERQHAYVLVTIGLVGMVGAVVGAVASLGEGVAAPLEALAVALRHVARTVPPRHRHVAEHQQARNLLKGPVGVDTEGGRWEVNEVVCVAEVGAPRVRECTVSGLVETNLGISEFVPGLHGVEGVVDGGEPDVRAGLPVDGHLDALARALRIVQVALTLFLEMPLTGKVNESASTCPLRSALHTSTVDTGAISADTVTANVRTPSCRTQSPFFSEKVTANRRTKGTFDLQFDRNKSHLHDLLSTCEDDAFGHDHVVERLHVEVALYVEDYVLAHLDKK